MNGSPVPTVLRALHLAAGLVLVLFVYFWPDSDGFLAVTRWALVPVLIVTGAVLFYLRVRSAPRATA